MNEAWQTFPMAQLLGNGHMGAAVTQGPGEQRILLSHCAFYSGRAEPDPADGGCAEAFRLARAAALREDWAEADRQTDRFMGRKGSYGTSLPVGTLVLREEGVEAVADQRLDMREGVLHITRGSLTGELCCSHPDGMLLVHLRDPRGLQLRVSAEGVGPCRCETGSLRFETQALETRHSDGTCGTRLSGLLTADMPGGSVLPEDGTLALSGATECLLTLRTVTDWDCPDRYAARAALNSADAPSVTQWPELLARHTADFRSLMDRTDLRLPTDPEAELLHLTGRYLLASAARSDSPLPMSLQGVWNDDVACRIGWTCDMHLDINTQMNYWLAGPTGLSGECRPPLFRWLKERLIPQGR